MEAFSIAKSACWAGCLSVFAQVNIRRQSRYILWGSSPRENIMGLFIRFHPFRQGLVSKYGRLMTPRSLPSLIWRYNTFPFYTHLTHIHTKPQFLSNLFELTIKWAMSFDRSFLISVSILLIVWRSNFEIGCKFHWNRPTDELIVHSSATMSFAPTWK